MSQPFAPDGTIHRGVINVARTSCHGLPYPPWPPDWPTPPHGGDVPLPPTGDPGQPGSVPPSTGGPGPAPVPGDAWTPPEPLDLLVNPGPVWSYRLANDEGYPWADPTLHTRNYPMPGAFYDASNPGGYRFTGPLHYQRALLGSALVMAGMDTDLATSSAGAALRKQLADLQAVGEFNDGLYGTSATALMGGRQGVGPHDRGVNWEARHAPVRELLAARTAPYRTTEINGQRLAEHVEANRRPLLWNPAINLDVLRKERRVSMDGMQWPDGSSMINPPPAVMALGLEHSGVRFPGGVGYRQAVGQRGTARDWWRGVQ